LCQLSWFHGCHHRYSAIAFFIVFSSVDRITITIGVSAVLQELALARNEQEVTQQK
jgi:hypothetical protein